MEPFNVDEKYGRWTVSAVFKRRSRLFVQCVCDCGSTGYVSAYDLQTGHSTSCGCRRKEVTTALNTKHGHAVEGSNSRTYTTWLGMNNRCKEPGHISYKYYGGRGISVCDRWNSFENFLADMGLKPSGMTLDRINNDAGYSKENCRWATAGEQSKNKRRPAVKDRCRNGHLYTKASTKVNAAGHRNCRECDKAKHKRSYCAAREVKP